MVNSTKEVLSLADKLDILLVDDKPANLVVLEEMLASPDLNFIRALNGEQALEAALHSCPALILLDVYMPIINGFEVARLLRRTTRTKEIPIIFITDTYKSDKLCFQDVEGGPVDYLMKPLNSVVLKSKVKVFIELHRNRMKMEKMLIESRVINDEIGSFSYSVSHDLRNPLNSVLGYAEALLEDFPVVQKDEELKSNVERIVESCNKIVYLIDGLLRLARGSTAQIRKSSVDLSELIKQIVDEYTSANQMKNVHMKIMDGVIANCDKALLEIVLRNLIENSLKFTSKVSTPSIDFGVKQIRNERVIYLRDNGAGFDMALADRLFSPFTRLHSDDVFKGTGVGLATVQRIVRRHGGRIWAEGQSGKGATFFIAL